MFDWLPLGAFETALALPYGEALVAAAFFGLTATIYASGVPGALLPLSFSSGALLGGALGILAVAAGALLGSLVLYWLLERGSRATLRERFGHHLARMEGLASSGGIVPIIGLRLAGIPHLAVTALCALASVGPRRYALATFIGICPAISLTAIAGAAL